MMNVFANFYSFENEILTLNQNENENLNLENFKGLEMRYLGGGVSEMNYLCIKTS